MWYWRSLQELENMLFKFFVVVYQKGYWMLYVFYNFVIGKDIYIIYICLQENMFCDVKNIYVYGYY